MKMSALLVIICSICGGVTPLSAQFLFNVKQTFRETDHQIYFTGYSDRGSYIITTGSDNNIILWNAESGIIYRTLAGLKKRPVYWRIRNACIQVEKTTW